MHRIQLPARCRLSYYSTEYDFVGNILKSHELHTSDMQSASPANTADRSGSHRKLTEFTYDHRGRLLTEKTTLDDNELGVADNDS